MSSHIHRRESLWKAERFEIERRTILLNDGEEHSREVIQHPGAVVILPVFEDGRICLIRNYRMAIDVNLLELPAGTLEPPEPPIVTAERELREETGYSCGSIISLGEFFMSPGILNEKMHAFLARDLTAGNPALEVGELIEQEIFSESEVREKIAAGELQDSKTLSALLLYWQKREGGEV